MNSWAKIGRPSGTDELDTLFCGAVLSQGHCFGTLYRDSLRFTHVAFSAAAPALECVSAWPDARRVSTAGSTR